MAGTLRLFEFIQVFASVTMPPPLTFHPARPTRPVRTSFHIIGDRVEALGCQLKIFFICCKGNAWATGFGAYNLTVPSPPQKFLQKKEVQMIPNSECLHNKTDPPTRANERVICTRQDGGGVCFGDSGSPLYVWTKNVTWTQVGIVSGGTSCNNGLGLFVKISHFVGWIHRRISGCGNFPTSHFDQP